MRELDRSEIEAVLVHNGIGVLGLVDDDQPYVIPMSYGYDREGSMFVMQFGHGSVSRKVRSLEANPRASFTVYEEHAEGAWRSVVLTGELYEVPGAEMTQAFDALAENATFAPDLSVWGEPLADVDFDVVGFEIEEWDGRGFSMGD